jgi:hypothetical protein
VEVDKETNEEEISVEVDEVDEVDANVETLDVDVSRVVYII